MDSTLLDVAVMLFAALVLGLLLTLWHVRRFEQREQARRQVNPERQERQ
jgi:hypothetical protein